MLFRGERTLFGRVRKHFVSVQLSSLNLYCCGAADDVTPLVGVPVPASCGDFQVTKLLVCQVDLEFKEGCCEQSCKDVLSSVSCFSYCNFSNTIFSCGYNIRPHLKHFSVQAIYC